MRRLSTTSIISLILTVWIDNACCQKPDNFEILFTGNGNIASYIYFKQDGTYFIDTDLSGSLETCRYKNFYFLVDLYEETYMGRKYHSNMVFDPNRGGWSFGVAGRFEFENHFIDIQLHHDCFHDIGRWNSVDYSIFWNSPRVGYGSKGYLPKYKYHQYIPQEPGLYFPNKIDYYLLAGFYAPRGAVWQKNHDYNFTLNTDLCWQVARYKHLGFDIESNNLWVINTSHELKRKHGLDFNLTVYGKNGVLKTYIGWWPYDSQSIRNRDGKAVFGVHLGF